MHNGILVLLLLSASSVCAQQEKIYKTFLVTLENKTVSGVIVTLSDTTVQMISMKDAKSRNQQAEKTAWPIASIKELKTRPAGSVGRGMLIGGITGGVVGAVIGAAAYEPCDGLYCLYDDKSTSVLIGILTGVPAGVGIGAGIGSGKQRFVINGRPERFYELRTTLLKYLFVMPDK